MEELRTATGGDLAYVAGHVGKVEDMDRVLDATLEAFGALDVLVNNAATNPYAGPVIDIDVPRWEKTFATNLTTPLVWTQACWNRWMKEHGGSVVNISSVGAFGPIPPFGVYDLTKRALIHLTEQLGARRWARPCESTRCVQGSSAPTLLAPCGKTAAATPLPRRCP
ncbi:MAG: hypothetical protein Ct9H300mP12_06430 [Acidimicrobiales bacterium]|nr:MAG: hypothetical protein Ct9H300mP12_06430 [Acidimicrobiales bacterium]